MSPINSLWFKWKSLRLPWRKMFLVGQDLSGNTFWEFKDAVNANRLRRIVRYNPRSHYADVKITPQWHQWLRQVRPDPPNIEEQQAEVARQMQLKQLARLADERWASKPSYLDKPREQPGPATIPRDPAAYVGQTEPDEKEGVRSGVESPADQTDTRSGAKADKKNPWAQERGGPSEGWQPKSWTPDAARR